MAQEPNDVIEALRSREDVTPDNFWEKQQAYRAWLSRQVWRDLRCAGLALWRSTVSLCTLCITRKKAHLGPTMRGCSTGSSAYALL